MDVQENFFRTHYPRRRTTKQLCGKFELRCVVCILEESLAVLVTEKEDLQKEKEEEVASITKEKPWLHYGEAGSLG